MKENKILLILIVFSLLFVHILAASAIAIDFGSEFITTSIIRSRKPIKSPEAVFHHLQEFLGKTEESTELKNYMKKYFQTFDIVTDERTHLIKFKVNYHNQQYLFTSQELLGMMLRYIKDFSDKYGQTDIKEFIITVPCFYGYKQHQAIVNAAEISGMKLLRIIHDNTAVAIKYFNENRAQKEVRYFVFYNMGASYT